MVSPNGLMKVLSNTYKPLVISAPIARKPLVLYIAAQDRELGSLFAQDSEDGKEKSTLFLELDYHWRGNKLLAYEKDVRCTNISMQK